MRCIVFHCRGREGCFDRFNRKRSDRHPDYYIYQHQKKCPSFGRGWALFLVVLEVYLGNCLMQRAQCSWMSCCRCHCFHYFHCLSDFKPTRPEKQLFHCCLTNCSTVRIRESPVLVFLFLLCSRGLVVILAPRLGYVVLFTCVMSWGSQL